MNFAPNSDKWAWNNLRKQFKIKHNRSLIGNVCSWWTNIICQLHHLSASLVDVCVSSRRGPSQISYTLPRATLISVCRTVNSHCRGDVWWQGIQKRMKTKTLSPRKTASQQRKTTCHRGNLRSRSRTKMYRVPHRDSTLDLDRIMDICELMSCF